MISSELYFVFICIFAAIMLVSFVPYILKSFQQRESVVITQVKRHLNPEKYWLLSKIAIRTRELTVIVDHIIVSQFGIFIIQEKDFAGTVEGQANHRLWVSKRLSKEKRFKNPLVNNRKSLSLLKSCYGHTDSLYHSLVIFSGNGKFKGAMPGNVRTEHDFIDYIKSKVNQIMLPEEAKLIKEQIESGRIPNTLKTYSQYLDHAQSLYKEYTSAQTQEILEDGRQNSNSAPVSSKEKDIDHYEDEVCKSASA